MRPRAALAGAAVVLLAARSPQDDANLRKIQGLLETPAVACGRFEQAKTLVGLRRPVRSSGRFCAAVGKGVLWTTLLPFPATLRLTKDEIVESHGGEVTTRLSARQEPTVEVINELLFSLLQGNFDRLTATFTVHGTVDGREWKATLVPKAGGLQRIIRDIDLSGGRYVGELEIHEASGDATRIVFSGVETGLSALLPEEARQLGVRPAVGARPGGHAR